VARHKPAEQPDSDPVIRVRRIHRRDLNRVWDFLKKVFRSVNRETVEYQRPRTKTRFLEIYEEEGIEQLLFEVHQGAVRQVVGYAECAYEVIGSDNWINERYFDNRDMRPLFVEEIAIHPGFQGRGIGSFVIEQLEHLARVHGCTHLVLEVAANNKRAMQFYRARSFAQLDAAIFLAKKVVSEPELLPPRALRPAAGDDDLVLDPPAEPAPEDIPSGPLDADVAADEPGDVEAAPEDMPEPTPRRRAARADRPARPRSAKRSPADAEARPSRLRAEKPALEDAPAPRRLRAAKPADAPARRSGAKPVLEDIPAPRRPRAAKPADAPARRSGAKPVLEDTSASSRPAKPADAPARRSGAKPVLEDTSASSRPAKPAARRSGAAKPALEDSSASRRPAKPSADGPRRRRRVKPDPEDTSASPRPAEPARTESPTRPRRTAADTTPASAVKAKPAAPAKKRTRTG
jgi:ribosomal protein S18 acetylase RimI-like enzyme